MEADRHAGAYSVRMDSRCGDVPWVGSELATSVAALAQNDHGF